MVASGTLQGSQYAMDCDISEQSGGVGILTPPRLWHKQLEQVSEHGVIIMARNGNVPDLPELSHNDASVFQLWYSVARTGLQFHTIAVQNEHLDSVTWSTPMSVVYSKCNRLVKQDAL